MADLSKLRFDGTDYNVKDASAPTRKFTNTYSKTGNLPISSDDTTQTAIGKLENNIIPKSAKGTANGVAELDANGKVPSSQLPSYVDDVLEYSAKSSFPATGESGKIYVDTTTNKTYRWSGSAYVEISESLALGETDSTAYRGDRGKTAYDHSQRTSGNPHNVTKSDVGLGNVGNFKAVSTVASQGLSDTEKSNARANIGAGTGNGTYSKPSGGIPKSDLATAVQTALDQVNINKTNILYAINTGVKNFANAQAPSEVKAGLTVTNLDNGAVKLSATSQTWTAYYIGNTKVLPNTQYVISIYADSITNAPNFYFSVFDTDRSGETLVSNKRITRTGETSATFTSISDTLIINVYPNNSSTALTTDVTIRIMLCVKSVYDQDPSYQPHALSNSDLTYLEAEDRAALAEVVDSGTKNLLPFSGGTITSAGVTVDNVTFTANSDGSVTINSNGAITGTKTASVFIGTLSSLIKNTGDYVLYGNSNNDQVKIAFYYTDNWYGVFDPDSSETSTYIIHKVTTSTRPVVVRIRVLAGAAISNVKIYPMICTKAAFGVSQKFVPYQYPSPKIVATLTKSITSSTTLEYTGLEYTIKANTHYRVTAFAKFSSNPLEIAICNTQNGVVFGYASNQDPSGTNMGMLSVVSYVLAGAALPIGIKAKYKSASTSTVGMIIEEL